MCSSPINYLPNAKYYSEDVVLNDYSSSFPQLRKSLVSVDGTKYLDLRKELTPKYFRTWLEISVHWILIFVMAVLTLTVIRTSFLSIGVFSVAFGVLIHRLHLFLHEGSHHNLARTAHINDLLTNIFIGSLVMSDVAGYRRHHSLHHRNLGLPTDPERSYQSILDSRFIFSHLIGFSAVQVIIKKRRDNTALPVKPQHTWVAPVGLLIHLIAVLVSAQMGRPLLLIAWIIATICIFPFIAATRQLLEHRPINQSEQSLFPVTRIFTQGLVTFLFGAAGFSRHLLHHWDPGIPHSRLGELERALHMMGCGQILDARKSNYFKTAVALWGRK